MVAQRCGGVGPGGRGRGGGSGGDAWAAAPGQSLADCCAAELALACVGGGVAWACGGIGVRAAASSWSDCVAVRLHRRGMNPKTASRPSRASKAWASRQAERWLSSRASKAWASRQPTNPRPQPRLRLRFVPEPLPAPASSARWLSSSVAAPSALKSAFVAMSKACVISAVNVLPRNAIWSFK